MELILGSVGAEVSFAENGKDACELIESRIFDAVLMDLQMPVMDGLTAIRKLRVSEAANGRPRLPIIAVSANAMTHHVDEALKAGADAHVAKPIDAAALFTQIASLCGAR